MEFRRVMYLRGPNVWTYRPVLEAWVDIGPLEDRPSNRIPGFYQRLSSLLPSLIEHRCGVGERGGFLQRVREGTWAGHILEHIAIELQNLAGLQTGFGKARRTSERGVYKVVIRARDERVGRAALDAGRDLLLAAIDDQPYDVAATVARLREMVDDLYLGPSTACIVDAATGRRIPWIRLNEGNLVQLGYGARQRRIWTAETDQTSAIAEGIASEKDLTKRLLAACGVPVPEGRVVASPADAWEAAQDIGLPVVVKPTDANHGRGVSLDLMSREDVEAAFAVADRHGSEVIVERFVPGNEHRLLVVGGRVVAGARGEAAWVVGDGRSSIVELVDNQINSDPRRGLTEDFPLNRIKADEDGAVVLELSRQNLRPDSVPAAGRKVLIQRNGNVAIDCTDEIHPEVAAVVSLAARVVGLDIAGIDIVAEDIGRPLAAQRGAVVEVNAGPGLLMHLKPASGTPRQVGRDIVEHLFPDGESGRIPIVGIAGAKGTTLIARLVAWLIQLSGRRTGLACADGLFLDRRRVDPGNCANWKSGQRLLMNRCVEAAVFENGADMILSEGLAYDRCQVGVVTDVSGADALRGYYIHEPEHVYSVLRTQVDVVLRDGVAVLNGADPQVAEMASLCDGDVIFYGTAPDIPVIAEHLDQCGRAVFLRDGKAVLATGPEERILNGMLARRLQPGDQPAADAEAILAAIATAWALGLSAEMIVAGITTFWSEQDAIAAGAARRVDALTA